MIDSNSIVADYRMSKPAFRVLRHLSEQGTVRAAISSPVRTEVLATYDRDLAETRLLQQETDKALRRRGLGSPVPPDNPLHYPTYFEQSLQTLLIETLPWPTTSHESLTERATSRRRPFDDTGSGYRDALIWETVLTLAADGHTVHLITNDNDFRHQNELHPELS